MATAVCGRQLLLSAAALHCAPDTIFLQCIGILVAVFDTHVLLAQALAETMPLSHRLTFKCRPE